MKLSAFDFSTEQREWDESLQLLIDEVMPHFPE